MGSYPWAALRLPTAMIFQPFGLKKLRAVGLEAVLVHGGALRGKMEQALFVCSGDSFTIPVNYSLLNATRERYVL